MNEPRLHATPPDAVKEKVRDKVFVDGQTILLDRPLGSDDLFDHPAVRAAYAADDYMPYWADLWPAARMLAKAVLREPWPGPLDTLDIGCGLGLVGIAALRRGLRVTFSDIDTLAVKFAAANAQLNGFHTFDTAFIDLRSPPRDRQFQVILGSDLLYLPRLLDPVVDFILEVLAPGGVCLLADPDREAARPFKWACESAGLNVTVHFARAGEPGGERTKGSIYRITRTAPNAMTTDRQ